MNTYSGKTLDEALKSAGEDMGYAAEEMKYNIVEENHRSRNRRNR